MPIDGANTTGDDRGETLLELLIALAILGIAVVAIVGGLASSILISDVHRKQAQTGVIVRDYAEALQAAVAASQSNYGDCQFGTPDYKPLLSGVPATGFTSTVSVQFWDGSAFGSCPAGGDTGLQRVTLTVNSGDGRARQSLIVMLRKPCRPTDAACS